MTLTPTDTARAHATLPFDRLAGTTPLFRDYLSKAAALQPYLGPAFDDDEALRALAGRVTARAVERDALVAALTPLAEEVEASAAARSNLDRLKDADTLTVFAGQQTGLFFGPLYTLYKALTVEHWAAQLSKTLGRRVVPCFWLSTDDHDFAEVDHVCAPRGQQLVTLRYEPACAPAGDPVGRVHVDGSIESVLAEYAELLPDSEFKPDVFAILRDCYRPGVRFSAAFGRLWYRLFPQSGLVMVSPCNRDFKKLAAPYFEKAIRDDSALYQCYAETSEALERDGYHRQVHKTERQTFLFYQQFKRHSIHHGDESGFVWEGAEPVTREWLERMIRERPDYFSSNVLLRPIIQNGVFPTVGVVLGPSELAYYAQIGGLHDYFGVPRPAVLPRTSATLLEQSVRRRVDKLGLEFEALQKDADAEIARVLRARFPQDLEAKFDEAGRRIEEAFESVRPDVIGFESTLDKPLRMAAGRARREMSHVAQRAHAAHKRKEEETETQIRRLALQLFPGGGLQERSYNIVFYWARYGPELLSRLYEEWPAGVREHVLWEL